MDDQRGHWTYFDQDKDMDMVRQSVLVTMELEKLKRKAQDELKSRDLEIAQLKNLLSTAIKERDEAQANCQKLSIENIFLQQPLQSTTTQQQQYSGISSIDQDDYARTAGLISISSDSDESSSPHIIINTTQQLPRPETEPELVVDRPLPEKGKLLEAVMKAGPLLQTLLLAGPLPQWRHPPPPLDAYQIPPPPVVIPTLMSINQNNSSLQWSIINNCGKRGLYEGSDFSSVEFKYQRVALHQ